MLWRSALKIAAWQLAVSILVAICGYVSLTYLEYDLPSSMAAIAMMLGAQSFALSAERKAPGAVIGRVWPLAWRASILDTATGCGLGYAYLIYTASLVPEFGAILDQINRSPVTGVFVLAATFALTLGLTALGLHLGGKMAVRMVRKYGTAKGAA